MSTREDDLIRRMDADEECCINGHVDGCDSLEPAWDIGDLLARSGCTGCCPNGCEPKGLQSEQDQASQKAKGFFS